MDLTFGTLPGGVSAGLVPKTVVSITDDDVPSVTVSFGSATYPVDEGDTVTVTVTLSADPERSVTIPLSTANQGGASDSDYSGVPANVTFNSGETEKSFTFTASDDAEDDDGESVDLTFGSPLPAGVSTGSVPETTVSINDDDVPAVEVSFEHSSYDVAESDDASTVDKRENEVTVKVTLSADPERTVTIPLSTANQGGASDSDYSGVPANVTFNSGETEKSFTFTATQDSVDDDGESVDLTFGTLPGGVSAGLVPKTVVSITDDDVPSVTVSFGSATYPVDEGDTVTVTVTLSEDPERSVTIPLSTANQGGASDSDYSGVPANVTFNSGETEKSFTFTASDDAEDDDGESVDLTFGSPLPGGCLPGASLKRPSPSTTTTCRPWRCASSTQATMSQKATMPPPWISGKTR